MDKQNSQEGTAAWILDFGPSHIALGEFEVLHILDQMPEKFPIPQSPPHCREVILWEEQLVPLFDLNILVGGARPKRAGDEPAKQIVTIVAFHPSAGAIPQYAALVLSKIPQRHTVQDMEASALPQDTAALDRFTQCAFLHPEFGQIRVLDLPRLFSAPAPIAHPSHKVQ
ncbi:MAG: chemotaxis protein CheW [Burkholderiales bacterium]